MVAYDEFLRLSLSGDSAARGQAAHLVGAAYIEHDGPLDEKAALYAALIGFLDDSSVKVRAALAYGLLHSDDAPRVVMLALAKDAPVIGRAVVQYSPVLLDADLKSLIKGAREQVVLAMCSRNSLSAGLIDALLSAKVPAIERALLARTDIKIEGGALSDIADRLGKNAGIRGLLLARAELSGATRLDLVECARRALMGLRLVKGSIAPQRLERMMRDAMDSAVTRIGEGWSSADGEQAKHYVQALLTGDKINTRILLSSLINGQVLFFSDCVAALCALPRKKVFSILQTGPRAALNAMFARAGMVPALRNLLARIVIHARSADLGDDIAARLFVVTALIEELIIEHDGQIPSDLHVAFAYLNEQNIALARVAARNVMPNFAQSDPDRCLLEEIEMAPALALPAA